MIGSAVKYLFLTGSNPKAVNILSHHTFSDDTGGQKRIAHHKSLYDHCVRTDVYFTICGTNGNPSGIVKTASTTRSSIDQRICHKDCLLRCPISARQSKDVSPFRSYACGIRSDMVLTAPIPHGLPYTHPYFR